MPVASSTFQRSSLCPPLRVSGCTTVAHFPNGDSTTCVYSPTLPTWLLGRPLRSNQVSRDGTVRCPPYSTAPLSDVERKSALSASSSSDLGSAAGRECRLP